jgi:hypothetical protein
MGFAGKTHIGAIFRKKSGFVDISGRKGGYREVSLSGSFIERNT